MKKKLLAALAGISVLLGATTSPGATAVFPASTNGNNTFFGTNNFIGPLLINGVPAVDASVTNDLATTNWVGGNYQTISGATTTNGFVDSSVTNGLSTTNWVGDNYQTKQLAHTTNGFADASVTNGLATTNWVGLGYQTKQLAHTTNGYIGPHAFTNHNDVVGSTLTSGDYLGWNALTSKWTNGPPAAGAGSDPNSLTNQDQRIWTNWTGIYGNALGLTNYNFSSGTISNWVTAANKNVYSNSSPIAVAWSDAQFNSYVTNSDGTRSNWGGSVTISGTNTAAQFVGGGSGLTGTLTNNTTGNAATATTATSASNATNLWGGIQLSNLPSGVLTNGQSTATTLSNAVALSTGTGGINGLAGNATNAFEINTAYKQKAFNVNTNGNSYFAGAVTSSSQFSGQSLKVSTTGYPLYMPNGVLYCSAGSPFTFRSAAETADAGIACGNLVSSGTLTATNGVVQMVKPSFTTNFTCTTNLQTYLCNGTNQLVTLPNASNVVNVIYRFASTNGWGKFIITNATGAQTIRDGSSLSFQQVGIGSPSFFSDGQHWWSAARTKVIMPNAQFSCSTNIPLTSANTAYPVTFNSTDFNNSQGIALLAGTNGLLSKMWITNAGQYEFLPSIVIGMGNVAHTVRYWFRQDDTNIVASCTPTKVGGNDTVVVTVAFNVNVTGPTGIEIWAESDGTGDSLTQSAASGNYPSSPSVICPVKRISDPWP